MKLFAAESAISVVVRIGEFRNVDPGSLSFAFDSLKQSYAGLEQCQLKLELVEAMAICQLASHRYHASPNTSYRCTKCGSGIGKLLTGDELDITNIVVITGANSEAENYARTN